MFDQFVCQLSLYMALVSFSLQDSSICTNTHATVPQTVWVMPPGTHMFRAIHAPTWVLCVELQLARANVEAVHVKAARVTLVEAHKHLQQQHGCTYSSHINETLP